MLKDWPYGVSTKQTLAVFSPETENIKKLANFTANTTFMGKQHYALNPKPYLSFETQGG